MIVDLDQQAREQIERIVRMTGKPEKTVIREVVTNGLKTYNAAPSKSAIDCKNGDWLVDALVQRFPGFCSAEVCTQPIPSLQSRV